MSNEKITLKDEIRDLKRQVVTLEDENQRLRRHLNREENLREEAQTRAEASRIEAENTEDRVRAEYTPLIKRGVELMEKLAKFGEIVAAGAEPFPDLEIPRLRREIEAWKYQAR